ncbi:hypothetical protein C8Q80DRAFT_1118622 [Daedaleopsis nitida]|nr:hypothetical protein C8Q80DRAFT_1118622 [Daedaleopsis nitida]
MRIYTAIGVTAGTSSITSNHPFPALAVTVTLPSWSQPAAAASRLGPRRRVPRQAHYALAARVARDPALLEPERVRPEGACTPTAPVIEFPIFHVLKNQSLSASMLASTNARKPCFVASDQPVASEQ